jgi:hypothetical protein
MEQNCFGRLQGKPTLPPPETPTPSRVEHEAKQADPEPVAATSTLEDLLRPHSGNAVELQVWINRLRMSGVTTTAEFHATHPSVLIEDLGLPKACLNAWKGGRPLRIGGTGKFRMDHNKDTMYEEAD